MSLASTCTQAEFGALVGISQQAVSEHLQALPVALKMRCPNLTGDDLKIVETCVAETLNLAASMSLASLSAMDDEDPQEATS